MLAGCQSEAARNREVFECSQTSNTAACLQARYGWEEQDALVAAFKARHGTE